MKITALETIRIAERPNLIWLQVHTVQRLIGLGETFFGASTVEAHVHDYIAPRVIGRDPLEIDKLSADLVGYLGFRSSGAEVRGNSAFDITPWDIFGKATGQPIAQLLGRFTRREIRTYNTCAGSDYVKKTSGQVTESFGLGQSSDFDDLNGFLHRADELARSLLEDGITAMKIWPFDAAAEHSRGQYISAPDIDKALAPFEKIRRAVGNKMVWRLPHCYPRYEASHWHKDPLDIAFTVHSGSSNTFWQAVQKGQ